MGRIDGIVQKIECAKKHIAEFEAKVQRFSAEKPYTLGAKPHRLPEIHHTTLYVASVRPIPDDFSTIIGDSVHNLRSALDHLAWKLVEAGGGTPGRDTYFPIVAVGSKSTQQYASAIGKGGLDKISPGAEAVLSSVQPYVSGDNTLWHLHELDRIDKHRLLLTAVSSFGYWAVNIGMGNHIEFPESMNIPLQVGYEIVNLPTTTYATEAHDNFELGIVVTFGQDEIVREKPVLETLKGMADFVATLLPKFEPFLS